MQIQYIRKWKKYRRIVVYGYIVHSPHGVHTKSPPPKGDWTCLLPAFRVRSTYIAPGKSLHASSGYIWIHSPCMVGVFCVCPEIMSGAFGHWSLVRATKQDLSGAKDVIDVGARIVRERERDSARIINKFGSFFNNILAIACIWETNAGSNVNVLLSLSAKRRWRRAFLYGELLYITWHLFLEPMSPRSVSTTIPM